MCRFKDRGQAGRSFEFSPCSTRWHPSRSPSDPENPLAMHAKLKQHRRRLDVSEDRNTFDMLLDTLDHAGVGATAR